MSSPLRRLLSKIEYRAESADGKVRHPLRGTIPTPATPELLACMSAFPHDLTREALWIFGAPVSVPDATRPNIDLVVSHGHSNGRPQNDGRRRSMY
jgi:hypothetical protein